MLDGLIEMITPYFAQGWAAGDEHGPAFLIAECDGRLLGTGLADLARGDLKQFPERQAAFLIEFASPIAAADIANVNVRRWDDPEPLPIGARARLDDRPATQIFVVGSPRSGTSELGATLTAQLGLPWVGEGHVGPAFAAAAAALSGDTASANGMVRLMSEMSLADQVRAAARKTYYLGHLSASFVDKTPGVAMVRAAPFLHSCFPDAHFIFLRRNGISNVLSRMVKFGGVFHEHCQDWAAAMDAWEEVRVALPHFLEIEQETMLAEPGEVARAVAAYLARPEASEAIGRSLAAGRLEATGAGVGKTTLAETGWTPLEIETFRRHAGAAMGRWGYSLE